MKSKIITWPLLLTIVFSGSSIWQIPVANAADPLTTLSSNNCNPAKTICLPADQLLPTAIQKALNGDSSLATKQQVLDILSKPNDSVGAKSTSEVGTIFQTAINKTVTSYNSNYSADSFTQLSQSGQVIAKGNETVIDVAALDQVSQMDYYKFDSLMPLNKLDQAKLVQAEAPVSVASAASSTTVPITFEFNKSAWRSYGYTAADIDSLTKYLDKSAEYYQSIAGDPVLSPKNRHIYIDIASPFYKSASAEFRPYIYVPVCLFGKCAWLQLLNGDRVNVSPSYVKSLDGKINSELLQLLVHEAIGHGWKGSRPFAVDAQFEESYATLSEYLVTDYFGKHQSIFNSLMTKNYDADNPINKNLFGGELEYSTILDGPLAYTSSAEILDLKYDNGARALLRLYNANNNFLYNLNSSIATMSSYEYWSRYLSNFAVYYNKQVMLSNTEKSNRFTKDLIINAAGQDIDAGTTINNLTIPDYINKHPIFQKVATAGKLAQPDIQDIYLVKKNDKGVSGMISKTKGITGTMFAAGTKKTYSLTYPKDDNQVILTSPVNIGQTSYDTLSLVFNTKDGVYSKTAFGAVYNVSPSIFIYPEHQGILLDPTGTAVRVNASCSGKSGINYTQAKGLSHSMDSSNKLTSPANYLFASSLWPYDCNGNYVLNVLSNNGKVYSYKPASGSIVLFNPKDTAKWRIITKDADLIGGGWEKYTWQYGDGNVVEMQLPFKQVYKANQNYTVPVRLRTALKCTSKACRGDTALGQLQLTTRGLTKLSFTFQNMKYTPAISQSEGTLKFSFDYPGWFTDGTMSLTTSNNLPNDQLELYFSNANKVIGAYIANKLDK